MEHTDFEILALGYLRGELNEKEAQKFEALLNESPFYMETLEAMESSWNAMDSFEVPEPSERMDTKFFQMLGTAMEKKEKASAVATTFEVLRNWLLRPQLAYGLLLLSVGLGAGYFLKQGTQQQVGTTVVVSDDATEVREKLVLTLLEQPSANKRLEGVSEANKIAQVDATVIDALLKTLNKDANVNVRLAAIESLTNYVGNARVRQGLIQSIPNQESPIVQVTLANLMLALEEKKSIAPFKRLLKEQELDTTVKKKIEVLDNRDLPKSILKKLLKKNYGLRLPLLKVHWSLPIYPDRLA